MCVSCFSLTPLPCLVYFQLANWKQISKSDLIFEHLVNMGHMSVSWVIFVAHQWGRILIKMNFIKKSKCQSELSLFWLWKIALEWECWVQMSMLYTQWYVQDHLHSEMSWVPIYKGIYILSPEPCPWLLFPTLSIPSECSCLPVS